MGRMRELELEDNIYNMCVFRHNLIQKLLQFISVFVKSQGLEDGI